jgi:hypothetical protein
MNWIGNKRVRKHAVYTMEDAAEQVREGWAEAISTPCPCPYCGVEDMNVWSVSVEDRIKLRIGQYRMAQCSDCGAYCVAKTGRQARTIRDKELSKQFREEMKRGECDF